MKKKIVIIGLTILLILGFICLYLSSEPVSCLDLGCWGAAQCIYGVAAFIGCGVIKCARGGGGIICPEPN